MDHSVAPLILRAATRLARKNENNNIDAGCSFFSLAPSVACTATDTSLTLLLALATRGDLVLIHPTQLTVHCRQHISARTGTRAHVPFFASLDPFCLLSSCFCPAHHAQQITPSFGSPIALEHDTWPAVGPIRTAETFPRAGEPLRYKNGPVQSRSDSGEETRWRGCHSSGAGRV